MSGCNYGQCDCLSALVNLCLDETKLVTEANELYTRPKEKLFQLKIAICEE